MRPAAVRFRLRDELKGLFPHDENATRLSRQSFVLSEFLAREGCQPPPLSRRLLVQRHCHHHAVIGYESEQELLEAMGLDVQLPDTGCCGMAGSFGFESAHYEVSKACGERALFPEIEARPEGTLLLADGFSFCEQIRRATGREALHFASWSAWRSRPSPLWPSHGARHGRESAPGFRSPLSQTPRLAPDNTS